MNTNIDREKIVNILHSTLQTYLEEHGEKVEFDEFENTKLFGGDGILDSIGLVSFIVEVEEVLEDEYNIAVILADEKAMSRRTSPFGRISYLADYIVELLDENSNEK